MYIHNKVHTYGIYRHQQYRGVIQITFNHIIQHFLVIAIVITVHFPGHFQQN